MATPRRNGGVLGGVRPGKRFSFRPRTLSPPFLCQRLVLRIVAHPKTGDGPLGVQLVVNSPTAKPLLQKVEFSTGWTIKASPGRFSKDTFAADCDRTLNLNTLQARVQECRPRYSRTRAIRSPGSRTSTGPARRGVGTGPFLPEGTVQGVEAAISQQGGFRHQRRGRNRSVVKNQADHSSSFISHQGDLDEAGEIFRPPQTSEEDIKRLYGTGLFGDCSR